MWMENKLSKFLSCYQFIYVFFLKLWGGQNAYHTISILLTACVDACSHMYKIYMIFYSFGFNTFSFLAFYKSNISAIRLIRKTCGYCLRVSVSSVFAHCDSFQGKAVSVLHWNEVAELLQSQLADARALNLLRPSKFHV